MPDNSYGCEGVRSTGTAPEHTVFVCSGNTCRSPMAAWILNRLLGAAEDAVPPASSAGTSVHDPEPIHPHAARVLEATLTTDDPEDPEYQAWARYVASHRSRPIDEAIVARASRVLTMTAAQCMAIRLAYPDYADRVMTLTEAAGQPEAGDIPDPFGGDLATYRATYEALLRFIRAYREGCLS